MIDTNQAEILIKKMRGKGYTVQTHIERGTYTCLATRDEDPPQLWQMTETAVKFRTLVLSLGQLAFIDANLPLNQNNTEPEAI